MKKKWITEFFELLKERMDTYTEDNVLQADRDNSVWTLSNVFGVSSDNEAYIFSQASLLSLEGESFTLEIYIELYNNAEPESIQELQNAIQELNLFLPAGALGIYPGKNQVFYRYCHQLFPLKTVWENVENTLAIFNLIIGCAVALYPGLSAIWNGELTYGQTVYKKLLEQYTEQIYR